jgi:hypothetical protein
MAGRGYSKIHGDEALLGGQDHAPHAGAAAPGPDGKQAGVFWYDDKWKGPARRHHEEEVAELPGNAERSEYDSHSCPNVIGNPKMARLWESRFYWLHFMLMIGYGASWIVQSAVYGTTSHFNICTNVAHSMPSGNPLVSSVHRIGNVHLFWYTLWPAVIMSVFHFVLTCWPKYFYDWYYLNVIHEQASIKYLLSAVPWFFMTLTLASSVGVTDIYLLLALGILSAVGELCMGMMEWANAHRFKNHNESVDRIYTIFKDRNAIEWWEQVLDRFVVPQVEWVSLWVCMGSHAIVVATILGYFGYEMAKNSHDVQWWVVGAVSVYIAMLGLQIIQAIGYWRNMYPFICYVYAEYAHLALRFVTWSLITFFVLAGGGGNSNAVADGCLYPLA